MSSILVRRKRQGTRDAMRRYKVLIDGEVVGKLKPGEELDSAVSPGRHQVEIKIDWKGSEVLFADVEDGQTSTFECSPGGSALAGTKDIVMNTRPYVHLESVDNPTSV